MKSNQPHNIKKQSGMTMIEILMTVLITAIGLLGIAAMQTTALKSSLESTQRTSAANVANELLERLRANPEGRRSNAYSIALAQNNLCQATPTNVCSAYYDSSTQTTKAPSSCTASQLATFDAWEITCGFNTDQNTLATEGKSLRAPNITVVCTDSDPGDADACSDRSSHTITVSWVGAANNKNVSSVRSLSLTSLL